MKRIFIILALLTALPLATMAQTGSATAGSQKFTLEFVGGKDLVVKAADGTSLSYPDGIGEGDIIAPGSTIITGKDTTAECKLSPNGSIVKIGKGATFTVKGLATQAGEKNAFKVAAGKVKTIAAKGSNITVSTNTAVCGVRGTDFVVQIDTDANGNPIKELVAVKKGSVEFDKVDSNGNPMGQPLPVNSGMAADAMAATFATFSYPASQYDSDFSDMAFENPEFQKIEADHTAAPDTSAPAPKAEALAVAVPGAADATPAATEDAAAAEAAGSSAKEEATSGIVKWLQEILGFELGSVTIQGTTYSKAIIQPNFDFGSLKMGLYLPIIYKSDLFDPKDWYHPSGNDEWSFGMQTDTATGKPLYTVNPLAAALDAASDLALKVKFLEVGQQLSDPFFVKVGSLNSLTIGHGLIMRNYDNSKEFPAVRRVGFNLGFDFGGFGFEALVNDLADPYIFGGRIYVRPVKAFPVAIGLDAALDTSPGSVLDTVDSSGAIIDRSNRDKYGNPMFISGGVDLDLPIIPSNPVFAIRGFADAAVTLPYTQADITYGSTTIVKGLQYKLFWDPSNLSQAPQNWGAATGFMGNVLFVNYRLEYRYYTGFFRPSFYDASYDKMRGSYTYQYYQYLTSQGSFTGTKPSIMGIYGEGGFSFLKTAKDPDGKLNIKIGYAWPWDPALGFSAVSQLASSSDELHAALIIKKGLIPIVDVSGSISYDRRGLASKINANIADLTKMELIDENTTFAGEVVLPVPNTPNLDVAAVFASVPSRDASGNIIYSDAAAGIIKQRPSMTIETRFHF